MAGPAVTFLDRFVLCRSRDVVMTGKAEPFVNGLKADYVTLDLVAVVAVAASYRRVDHFPEQSGVGGTVLGVTIYATRCDRVVLMGSIEPGTPHLMTGSTEFAA